MDSASENYKIIQQPDTSELLRYHLQVTDRVDHANEIRRHELASANLKQPPVHPVHQHAPISHAAQQVTENPNNVRAAERYEQIKNTIVESDLLSQQLNEQEQERNRRDMQSQIAAAATRKGEQPVVEAAAVSSSVGNRGGTETAKPVVNAQAKPAATAIPEWPPKG